MVDDWGSLAKQVKAASDIVEVVGSYMALRPAGPTFKGLCPFHQDHRPSFDVDPRRQRYRCWSCGKYGDVFTFVQEQERIDFRDALELLARRAGIPLEKKALSPQQRGRALMLDVVRWAAEQYHHCLLDAPAAEAARRYLGERRLAGETVRRWGLGFAPPAGDWLLGRAVEAKVSLDLLEKVGLLAPRREGQGYYDRFRDRILFPIRNPRGQAVGFGGRILPTSPYASRAPKYYNSAETPLFAKSELLYGLDQARLAAAKAGYLAVVEGYTDVLMAHQCQVPQVVATMGTALNARHVQILRSFAPRVVLVFDADQGGSTGVDRALEIFVSQEVDLRIATLPEGLDPCDLLVQQGAEPFRQALEKTVDPLDFKLSEVIRAEGNPGVEGRRRVMDAVLGIIALVPEWTREGFQVKRELIVGRIAQRLALKQETVWGRLKELQARRAEGVSPRRETTANGDSTPRAAPAAPEERELLELLLGHPSTVPAALAEIDPQMVRHLGLRELLENLYALHKEGQRPELDFLRPRIANPDLAAHAVRMADVGRLNADPAGWLRRILAEFRRRQTAPVVREIHDQLNGAADHDAGVALLRRLQDQSTDAAPGASSDRRRRGPGEEGFDGP